MRTDKNSRLWVLGAPDPEMEEIELLLKSTGEPYVLAHDAQHKRVTPPTAYHAVRPVVPEHAWHFILVECAVPQSPYIHTLRIDHHRPGDPGYGFPPDSYWFGSSLGQTVALLRMLGVQFMHRPWWYMVAAADHCLQPAYAGMCPGVDPGELLKFRVERKAKYQRVDVQVIYDAIRDAVDALRVAPRHDGVAYMTGQRIPELPEAAAYSGIPFLAGPLASPDGRTKYVLQSAPPAVVEAFLGTDKYERHVGVKLVGKYGDPARGFAGGYVLEEE